MQQNHDHSSHTLDACDVIDKINELDEHMNSISALVYIGNVANFDELDTGIFHGFLNSINIINNSSGHLLGQIRDYCHEV